MEGRLVFEHNESEETSYEAPSGIDSDVAQAINQYQAYVERKLARQTTLEFEALSYTWGNPGLGDKALVVKSVAREDTSYSYIDIGQGLSEAMRHLRYTDKSRTIWIDAICINQSDV